jgi:hypothetical protein
MVSVMYSGEKKNREMSIRIRKDKGWLETNEKGKFD